MNHCTLCGCMEYDESGKTRICTCTHPKERHGEWNIPANARAAITNLLKDMEQWVVRNRHEMEKEELRIEKLKKLLEVT